MKLKDIQNHRKKRIQIYFLTNGDARSAAVRAALRETHLAPAHLGSRCNFQTLPELLAVSATEYPRGKRTVPTNSETSPVLADENYSRQ